MIKNSDQRTVVFISVQATSLVRFRGPLIRRLVSKGEIVHALASDFTTEVRREVEQLGAIPHDIRLERTGVNFLSDLFSTIHLIRLLKELRPDVTLSYFAKPVIFGTIAAWWAGVPHRIAMVEGLGYVFTAEASSWPGCKRFFLRFLVTRLYKITLALSAKVIFLNPDDRNEFVLGGLVDRLKTIQLGGIGVDLTEWKPAPIVMSPITFLLAGRLLREKGIIEFYEAAKIVKARHTTARFVLIGDFDKNPGSLSLSLLNKWTESGIVEWYGQANMKNWLRQTSVFVLPSYREGVPRSTQEAMSMGRAIITTDAPGCRETVQHGVNGFLVPIRSASALADAMLTFVRNPRLIELFGRESRRLAIAHFDIEKKNDLLEKLLIKQTIFEHDN